MVKQTIVYGFLMDFMNAIKYAISRKPAYRSYIESSPTLVWQLNVLDFVLTKVRERVRIPDLGLQSVWIGRGLSASCWILPDRFRPQYISDADRRRLEKLKLYFGDPNLTPSSFYLYSDEEPEDMRNESVPEDIAELSVEHVIGEFDRDTKGILRKLLGEEKMESRELQQTI